MRGTKFVGSTFRHFPRAKFRYATRTCSPTGELINAIAVAAPATSVNGAMAHHSINTPPCFV